MSNAKLWVTRDKYAVRCKLFARKPKRWSCYWSDAGYNNAYENVLLLLDSDLFPNLKWEDEPLEVELKEIISKDDTSRKMIYRNFIYNDVVIKGTTENESLSGENVYTITNPEVLELLNIRIFDTSDPYKFKLDEMYIDCRDEECDEDGYLVFKSNYKQCIFKKEGNDIKMYCPSFDRETILRLKNY